MLLFQRRKDAQNIESCGTFLNEFLHNDCGSVYDLAFTGSYSSDVDDTFDNFHYKEYLFLQYDSNDTLDADDAYIAYSDNLLFPNSPSNVVVHDILLDKICDISDMNCDSSDAYWKYIGRSWFHSSLCIPHNPSGNTVFG